MRYEGGFEATAYRHCHFLPKIRRRIDDADLLLHDEEDEDEVTADTSDVNTLDDGLFPDEDADIDTDEIPVELLTDDGLDVEIDDEADDTDKPKK